MGVKFTDTTARRGQGLVEYVLILLLIAVICVTAYSYLGQMTANRMPVLSELEEQQSEDGQQEPEDEHDRD